MLIGFCFFVVGWWMFDLNLKASLSSGRRRKFKHHEKLHSSIISQQPSVNYSPPLPVWLLAVIPEIHGLSCHFTGIHPPVQLNYSSSPLLLFRTKTMAIKRTSAVSTTTGDWILNPCLASAWMTTILDDGSDCAQVDELEMGFWLKSQCFSLCFS